MLKNHFITSNMAINKILDFSLFLRDKYQKTQVHRLAEHGRHDELASLIAKRFCDPNLVDDEGNTPLHLACKIRHSQCVQVLLASEKIDVNLKNNQGLAALHLAAQHGYYYCLNDLLVCENIDINIGCAYLSIYQLKLFRYMLYINYHHHHLDLSYI